MRCRQGLASATLAAVTAVQGASLRDIKHIVLFMQENRAFDHYFGTMAGVRGFGDPNVQINPDGQSTFEQSISPQNGTSILKPWHINYLGGDWVNASQCMSSGSNDWDAMHTAYNDGLGNSWVKANGPWSMGYYNRKDIPTHFDIAEGWTVMDMSSQSVLASTDPNRIMWMSGSINTPGSPTNADGKGSMIIDNNATPGCESNNMNCFPFTWKTFPENLEAAGISWQVWQDLDNFEDNMLAYFEQYQVAEEGSPLRTKGNSYPGLQAFYDAAENGTLPQVSWIIGPQELAEHPPNRPQDGAWLQKKVVDAITNSPAYNNTVLIISYDEQGGWADHVVPTVSPEGTPGEWFQDPFSDHPANVTMGPGPRTIRFIISPFTRGGNVFTEFADHTSDIQFVEEWAAANGYKGVKSTALTQWRRDHMSNLVNAFDFHNPDYSKPSITAVSEPQTLPDDSSHWSGNLSLGSLTGPWVGPAECLQDYAAHNPPVPYGPNNANQNMTLLVEEGFKRVRGQLTEGRYLTFEVHGFAMTNIRGKYVGISLVTKKHDHPAQRWIIHAVGRAGGDNTFYIQSALDKQYISSKPIIGKLTPNVKDAQAFQIDYSPNGARYSLSPAHDASSYVTFLPSNEARSIDWMGRFATLAIYSVSYH